MTPHFQQTPLNTVDDFALASHTDMMQSLECFVHQLERDAIRDHSAMMPQDADEALRWNMCQQSIEFYVVEQQNAFETQALTDHLRSEQRDMQHDGTTPPDTPTVWTQEPGSESQQLSLLHILMQGESAPLYHDRQSIEQITMIFLGVIRVLGWLAAIRQLYTALHNMVTLHNTVYEDTGALPTVEQTRRNLLLHLLNSYKNAHDEAVVAHHMDKTPWEWRAAMLTATVMNRITDRAQYERILEMERAALQAFEHGTNLRESGCRIKH